MRVQTAPLIAPVHAATTRADTAAERARCFNVLNHSDMEWLHRPMSTKLSSNVMGASNNGTVSLYKLKSAGLVSENQGGIITLTDAARRSLGCSL